MKLWLTCQEVDDSSKSLEHVARIAECVDGEYESHDD
jgi:hypothetical protein